MEHGYKHVANVHTFLVDEFHRPAMVLNIHERQAIDHV
jgi:hypothetical protein